MAENDRQEWPGKREKRRKRGVRIDPAGFDAGKLSKRLDGFKPMLTGDETVGKGVFVLHGVHGDRGLQPKHRARLPRQIDENLVRSDRQELGIPKEYAPTIRMGWFGRAGQNATAERRAELRRMATTRIAAMEKAARTAIESHSVEVQTELIAGSLSSDAAKAFLAKMPSVETLMPTLDATEIRGLLGHGSPT